MVLLLLALRELLFLLFSLSPPHISTTMALLLFALFLDSAHALVNPPRQTTHAEAANAFALSNGWTPKPTPSPQNHRNFGELRNNYAAIPHDMLFRRATNSHNTCAYLDGDADYPLTCDPGNVCAFWYSASPLAFNCCPPSPSTSSLLISSDCPYISTCLDYSGSSNAYSGSAYTISNSDAILSW